MKNKVLIICAIITSLNLSHVSQAEEIGDNVGTKDNIQPTVAQNGFPEFSWDKIPLYMHIRKATAYSDDELKFLSRFPLLTFEKSNGHKSHGSIEKGTLISAKAVKKLNPKAKILYYRNVIVHYSSYEANKELAKIPGAFLADSKGNTKLVRNRVEAYDLSDPKLRKWWVDHCKEMTADPAIDGLFLDGNIKALEPRYLIRELGVEKKDATIKGYHEMMQETRKAIGPDKLMLANIIRARFDNAGLEYLGYFDGSYLEGFSHEVGKVSRKDYMAKGIDAMQKAGREGKMVVFTSGFKLSKNGSEMGIDEGFSKVESDEQAREALIYPLAIFLISAEKYSYFRVHEGYSADNDKRWMRWFDEYDRPLGKPKAPAKKTGYQYIREFEHATVSLNLETEKAKITWNK